MTDLVGKLGMIGEVGSTKSYCFPITREGEACVHVWTKTYTNFMYACLKCGRKTCTDLELPEPKLFHDYHSISHDLGSNYSVVQCNRCKKRSVTQLCEEACSVK